MEVAFSLMIQFLLKLNYGSSTFRNTYSSLVRHFIVFKQIPAEVSVKLFHATGETAADEGPRNVS